MTTPTNPTTYAQEWRGVILTYEHFQRRRASALRVGLPFLAMGPGFPFILAQNDFLRGPPSG